MMPTLAPPSVLSAPQRRCQILLTLFQPGLTANTATFSELNGVDDDIASLDISETGREILRYHQLTLTTGYDGSYRVECTVLNQRLCLFHWLRRGFRLCPSFITSRFTPALKSELKRRGIARNFYDDTNLQALVNLCSRRLQKRFESRDIHFLCLYLQYCLLQHHAGITPQFNPLQRRWAESCLEFQIAQEIGRHWQRRALQPVPPDEPLFMALLFSMLRVPDPLRDAHQRDRQLRQSIKRLVNHFRELGNVRFYDEQGLCDQLYTHLAQALNRSLFAIGIDNTLPEEFDAVIINCPNPPFSRYYAEEIGRALESGRPVSYVGSRSDLGTIPPLDRFFTEETIRFADGSTAQVLKPLPGAVVLAAENGRAWALRAGNLTIVSRTPDKPPVNRADDFLRYLSEFPD